MEFSLIEADERTWCLWKTGELSEDLCDDFSGAYCQTLTGVGSWLGEGRGRCQHLLSIC